MIPTLLQAVRPQVLHRVWVISDLQQSIPAETVIVVLLAAMAALILLAVS